MNEQQLDQFIKALLDGIEKIEPLAERIGIAPETLTALEPEIERGISLIRGFRQFASENMKPAGLPPPPNPYLNRDKPMNAQLPEYYAFEAVQRGNMDLKKCLFTCTQLGLCETAAKSAIENVSMPWRKSNGWRTYVQVDEEGRYTLMDKPPVKIKRPLEHLRKRLAEAYQNQ